MSLLSRLLDALRGRGKRPVDPIDPPPPPLGGALGVANVVRRTHGLPPLGHDVLLLGVSEANNRECFRRGKIGHFVLAGGTSAQITAVGEIPSRAIFDWQQSPGHRVHLLSRTYTRAGFALSHGYATMTLAP